MSATPTGSSQPIRDTDLDRQFEQARRKLSQQQQRDMKATATATRHTAGAAGRREDLSQPGATPPRPTSAGNESLKTPASERRALSTAAQESQTPGAQSPTGQLPPKSKAARPVKETPPPPPHQVSRPAANHGRLWQDGTGNTQGKRNAHKAHSSSSTPASASRTPAPPISQHDPEVLIKQPETKPISQEQLIAEVKGIYAGLVMVENKCIEVDNAQNSGKDPPVKLNNEQWQALIALHRTLLHEHHDFFLASQHPSASPALTRLASKYAMPARMWRHGIHSFLELLRHRLPAAREHMLTFIYLAYSMMALLYETVPAFEETWIECLGDLGRYRMAIEDDNMSDREVWTSVSRHWYSKASDKSPSTGRLYHHLAILARPNVLQQLYYYTKALCVPTPFASARDSILTLFEPILNKTNPRIPSQDRDFVYMHAIIFKNIVDQHKTEMENAMESFIDGISIQIARNGRRWVDVGMHLANSNCAAMTGYGDVKNPIMAYIKPGKDLAKGGETPDVQMQDVSVVSPSHEAAVELATKTNRAVWSRLGDPSILAHLHVSLVFLYHLTFYPGSLSYVSKKMPWRMLCVQLDTLVPATENTARFESDEFPLPAKGEAPRPLVEDYAMRGLLWTEKYFPLNWFSNDQINDDDKWFEMPSFMDERRIRCLWLAIRIAKQSDFIVYDPETKRFAPGSDDDKKDNEDSSPTTAETTSGAATPTTAPTADDGAMEIDDEPGQKSVLPEILP